MSDIYGYARVSTREQNEDRQLKALLDVDVPKENIFVDKESGKDFNRVCYRRLVRRLRKDDVLYIKSIDRLGRNYEEIIEQWKYITKTRKADIVVIDMPILDTRQGKDLMGTFLSDIVLALLSYVSENERINIKQRQAEGIAREKKDSNHLWRCNYRSGKCDICFPSGQRYCGSMRTVVASYYNRCSICSKAFRLTII